MNKKICPRCKKVNAEFHKGIHYACKKCHNKSVREWKNRNKDFVKRRRKEFWEKNGDKINEERRIEYRKERKVKPESFRVDENGEKIIRITSRKFARCKMRFEIFKRDNFICQYCGRKAPNVELQVDHIYPKSKGGISEKENYITACQHCNIGKGMDILEIK